ncbi:hypothetical protein SUGI_0678380 [Cryptomeria japonica]|nr:hypothetical protein SUGI_0678380 [Cryptomeria japonica]
MFLYELDFTVSTARPSKIVLILVGTSGAAALIAVLWVLFMFRHSLRKLYTKVPGRSQHEEAGEEMPFYHKST